MKGELHDVAIVIFCLLCESERALKFIIANEIAPFQCFCRFQSQKAAAAPSLGQ
jgi:hypothetical protein